MPPAARSAPPTRPPWWRRLLFALIPLFGFLVAAELVARLVRAPTCFGSFRQLRIDLMKRNYPAARDALLAYVPRAGFSSRDNHWGTLVSIDDDGMRRNGLGPAPTGDRVIAAVGDSFTFGDQVDDDATWPAQLERQLGQPVKNGGVFGYSFTQIVLRAEVMLDRFPVTTLIVSFIADDLPRCELSHRYMALPWFDLLDGGIELRGVPLPTTDPPPTTSALWKDLIGCSALADAVLANTVREWWHENDKQVWIPHLRGRGPEIGMRLVDRLAKRCRERSVRLVLLLQGERSNAGAASVLQHAQAIGVQTLDLASAYAEKCELDRSLGAKWFDGHMTRAGNTWVADELNKLLQKAR